MQRAHRGQRNLHQTSVHTGPQTSSNGSAVATSAEAVAALEAQLFAVALVDFRLEALMLGEGLSGDSNS